MSKNIYRNIKVWVIVFVAFVSLFVCLVGVCGDAGRCRRVDYKNSLVVFDTGGGSKMPSLLIGEGQVVNTVDLPVRVGFYFLGYWDMPNGEGQQFFDATGQPLFVQWHAQQNIVLYANWHAKERVGSASVLELNNCGGVTNESHIICSHYIEGMSPISIPSKEGYRFVGYYDNAVLGKKYYDKDGKVTGVWQNPQDGTLYAHWELPKDNASVVRSAIIASVVFVMGCIGGIIFLLLLKAKQVSRNR